MRNAPRCGHPGRGLQRRHPRHRLEPRWRLWSRGGDRTGFRFPNSLGAAAESLAYVFWGDGWKLSYKMKLKEGGVVDKTAFWQPEFGYPPPPASGFEPVSAALVRDDDQACVYRAVVRTTDRRLYLTFTFDFQKAFPSVVLTTKVASSSSARLFDVIYGRAVDFDVHAAILNSWTSNDSAAFATNDTATPPVTLSVAGFVDGNTDCHDDHWRWAEGSTFGPRSSKCDDAAQILLVDEDTYEIDGAADPDYDRRGPGESIVKDRVPRTFDGFATIHDMLGELGPGRSKSVTTVYSGAFSKMGAPEPSAREPFRGARGAGIPSPRAPPGRLVLSRILARRPPKGRSCTHCSSPRSGRFPSPSSRPGSTSPPRTARPGGACTP